jgi:hypothetical protein
MAKGASAKANLRGLERVAFDRIQSFSRLPEAAFAVANALRQPAELN